MPRLAILVMVGTLAFVAMGADAQPDKDVGVCRALPPVEDVRLSDVPPALLDAMKRDIGRFVGPGEAFDPFDEVWVGVNRSILWVRHREDRWVVAYWRGGRFIQAPVLAYSMPLQGPAVLLHTAGGFPGMACQLTERELYR